MKTEKMLEAVRRIEEQQAKAETYSTVWMVGEQLKDILRAEPQYADLIAQDLENAEMGIAGYEEKIRARADELHRTMKSRGVGVSPREAEKIIRKFYGLPDSEAAESAAPEGVIDLGSFF